ncbi:MAG: hypothetical protein AAGC74_14770, partial [Verrucomicrobiota bacterium]
MGHYRKPWGHKVPMKYENEKTLRAKGGRAGLGGALGAVSETSRKRGRGVGWVAFGRRGAVGICCWTWQVLEMWGG